VVLFCFHRQSGLSQGAACQAKRGSVETASWASGFDYERRAVPESAPALVPGILQEGPTRCRVASRRAPRPQPLSFCFYSLIAQSRRILMLVSTALVGLAHLDAAVTTTRFTTTQIPLRWRGE